MIDPGDFLVNLDGDDCFMGNDALSVISGFVRQGYLFVFGRHKDLNGKSSIPRDSEAHVKKILSEKRTLSLWFDHPHCIYAGVLSSIPDERLMVGGSCARRLADRFLHQQAMELCGERRTVCTGRFIYQWFFPTSHNTFFRDGPAYLEKASAVFENAKPLQPLLFPWGS
jgi:hypothetical protein